MSQNAPKKGSSLPRKEIAMCLFHKTRNCIFLYQRVANGNPNCNFTPIIIAINKLRYAPLATQQFTTNQEYFVFLTNQEFQNSSLFFRERARQHKQMNSLTFSSFDCTHSKNIRYQQFPFPLFRLYAKQPVIPEYSPNQRNMISAKSVEISSLISTDLKSA